MKTRFIPDRIRYKEMSSTDLREAYLVADLFQPREIQLQYIDVDRAVVGSAVPDGGKLLLETSQQLASQYFAERREIGVINIGDSGRISVGDRSFDLAKGDSLYIGRGNEKIEFASNGSETARFYLLSYPAHRSFPTRLVKKEEANQVPLGSDREANKRTIYQAICPGVAESCQIVMGYTELAEGSVWNTMPPHTHHRRSEIYMYFDLAAEARVFHLMGEPAETRCLIMSDRQAVISPSWSIHCGSGTTNYSFVWGMGGENQEFTDMDMVEMGALT